MGAVVLLADHRRSYARIRMTSGGEPDAERGPRIVLLPVIQRIREADADMQPRVGSDAG